MALSSNGDGRAYSSKRSIAEFASGAAFGAALLASGVYAPSVIKMQMTFRSNSMIMVMMGGSAVSALVQDIGDRSKLLPKTYPTPGSIGLFHYDANVLGGALIGLGMGLTGSCPGTALVQAGVGMTQGFFVLAGGILGALAFVRLRPILEEMRSIQHSTKSNSISDPASETSGSKPRDLASALGVPAAALLFLWIPMCLAVMQIAFVQDGTVREVAQNGLVKPAYGGLLIGFAQLITTVFAGHTIGASGAYEDVARWVTRKATQDSAHSSPLLTPSLIFSGGVVASAAVLSHFMGKTALLTDSASGSFGPRQAALAVLGGISMGFGARMAKGCTSGHGISGLARFSIASLITTAALFTGGIVTTAILGRIGC